MIQFQRLLVALDLTKMDEILMKYVAAFAGQLGTEKIYFIHVVKSLELSEDISSKYPELLAPVDESCKHQIKDDLNCWRAEIPTEVMTIGHTRGLAGGHNAQA